MARSKQQAAPAPPPPPEPVVNEGEALSVADELLVAVRQHKENFRGQRENETDAAFIERWLTAVADVPDAIYEGLSVDAKEWFRVAADAANAGNDVPEPDGFASLYRPKTPRAEKKKKLITRDKPQKKTTEGPTMGMLIRQMVINDKNISVADLEAALATHGFRDIKRTTVQSFQRGSLDTLKVAEQMGRFAWPE